MTRTGRDRQREQLDHQRLPRSEQTVFPLFFVRTCKCSCLCARVKGIRKRGRVRIAPCTLPQAGPLPARHSLTFPVLRDELSNQLRTRPVPAFPHHRQPLMVLGIFKRHPRTSPWAYHVTTLAPLSCCETDSIGNFLLTHGVQAQQCDCGGDEQRLLSRPPLAQKS